MTDPAMQIIAQEAADRAVARVFQNLGVDPTSPDALYQLRQDIDFLRQARRGTRYGVKMFVTSLVAALGMAAWLGWNALIGK